MRNLCLLFLSLFSACDNPESEKIPIAIVTPATHPSLEQIEKGFKETIESENPGKYHFITYNAQGNKTLMRGEIEEIAKNDYPLVFTIGTLASQMTKEVFSKKGLDTPILFTAVNDPDAFHLTGNQITGVKELVDFEKTLACALLYKPNLQTLLLVFNPMEPGLSKDQQELATLLEKRGIKLINAEVFQTNEILSKTQPLIHQADAILVLKDNTVVGGLDALVKLSYQNQIPLIASDLDSPDRGAAFAYGVYEYDFGVEGAKKALQILNQNIPPSEIPITPLTQFTFKINKQAARAQGIESSLLEESP